MPKEIPLTRGQVAIVDDEDYEKVSKVKWQFSTTIGYAVGQIPLPDGSYSDKVLMHRYIMDAPPDKVTDHKNLNKLDNRKDNLRLCSRGENNRNIPMRKHNKLGYKGVYPHHTGRYQVHVRRDGKSNYVGLFDDIVEAAQFYNFWAFDLHGDFANVNSINGVKPALVLRG